MEKISYIKIGLTNYCNRKCDFCIIPMLGRNKLCNKIVMDSKTKDNIILRVNNNSALFNKDIIIQLFDFNEPFSDLEIHSEYANRLKSELSNFNSVKIETVTNGDFIINNFEEKYDKHLYMYDDIRVNDYEDTGMAGVLSKIESMSSKFELVEIVHMDEEYRKKSKIIVKYKNTTFHFYINSTSTLIKNPRGSVLEKTDMENWQNKDMIVRDYPCDLMGKIFLIQYDGSVMACPEVSCDIEKHQELKVGNINDTFMMQLIVNTMNLDATKLESCKYCLWGAKYCM